MRIPGLSLCFVACTLENPAFHASQTDGASTVASTTSPATDTGRPTTGGLEPTTSTSTSGPDPTTAVGTTTGLATSMNVSDSVATTDPPATTSTTDPPMTASSDPGGSSSGGPMMCVAFDDPPGPYTRLQSLPNLLPVLTDVCAPLQQMAFGGRLDPDNAGFTLTKDPACAPNNLPVPGLRVFAPLPPVIVGDNKCVTLTFQAHPGYIECTLSSFIVRLEDKAIVVGSFANASTPPNFPFQTGYDPKGLCACPGCCNGAPDPDLYELVVLGTSVSEMSSQELPVNNLPWIVTNLRSHVHHPECTGDAPKADWLHLDWVAAQVPG